VYPAEVDSANRIEPDEKRKAARTGGLIKTQFKVS